MKYSIRSRLLGTTLCVLTLFFVVAWWSLDRLFYDSVLKGVEEQLRVQVFAVMGAVDEAGDGITIDGARLDPRLNDPVSGLYAQLSDDISGAIWTSLSDGSGQAFFQQGEPGSWVFAAVDGEEPRYVLSFNVVWEGIENERVTFTAATNQEPYRATINFFRQSLTFGFLFAIVAFGLAQFLALRWGLVPLRMMAQEVEELEVGQRQRLSENYPSELEGLAGNLDKFVEHEQRSRSRYRNALDDLAHSLKTPLAVIRNALLDPRPDSALVEQQLTRMETTVTHQLSKASARGPVVVGKPVDVGHLVSRIIPALETAYADKGVQVTQSLEEGLTARGDESDFFEIFGNLIENAFKYCDQHVAVRVSATDEKVGCAVADDGPGIPADLRADVINRGKRLDAIKPGQGIGLAMVADLVDLYKGELEISDSESGGALITVWLPR